MMTPFPVPIQRRLLEINMDVILTNENPSFPVPTNRQKIYIYNDHDMDAGQT